LGIPLLSGRLLTEFDHNQPRYVVNQSFARRFFPNGNAVGQNLLLGVVSSHPETFEIVGVAGDVREFGLDAPPLPTLYTLDVSTEMSVLVKASANPKLVGRAVAAVVRRVNPQGAVGPVRTLRDYINSSLARRRFTLSLMAAFAGLAILLCVVGIYGVFGYSVNRRLREFAIRSAIGAQRSDLIGLILTECLIVVVPGLIVGVLIFRGCSALMRTLLYSVSPTDTLSYAIAIAALLFLCLGSAATPAIRAATVDPVRALRDE
jgi:putative ABC transport system permease protein